MSGNEFVQEIKNRIARPKGVLKTGLTILLHILETEQAN